MFLSTLLAGISRWFRYRDTLRSSPASQIAS